MQLIQLALAVFVVWLGVSGLCMMFAKFDRDEQLNEGKMPPMMWTAIKSYFACAWSAFTYIFQGMPADKQSYWKNCLGFGDPTPDLVSSWNDYRLEPSFHHLKNIAVEWTRSWPQRAAKLLALLGCILGFIGILIGMLLCCILAIVIQ